MPPSPSPSRAEIAAVYAAGVVLGVALVTFPAAGGILTSPDHYGLSTTQYGSLFLPQAVMAVLSSIFGPALTRKAGARSVFQWGLAASLLAMLLLLASLPLATNLFAAYAVLLAATTSMGLSFGLTVPTINTFASEFFPSQKDRAVLALNTLLGLGTALAPAFVAVFVGLGVWWGLPLLVALLAAGLVLFTLPLGLKISDPTPDTGGPKAPLPGRFFLFGTAALLYGICETMNGNWAPIFMAESLHANPATASLALTVFWGMVTGGRLLFAAIDRWIPERFTFVTLPVLLTITFLLISLLPGQPPAAGIAVFALAGFACSAMLPLLISFGQSQMPSIAPAVAGGLIAFYQTGYGIAAFGVGPLENLLGWPLRGIFGATTAMSAALIVFSLLIAFPRPRT